MSVVHSSLLCTEQERLRILAHLDELVESPAFSGSRRRQAFLRYVVEETLAGRGAAIKERNIAVDVFERNSDFDAQSASIVRVTGGDVRKRLTQAYASGLDHGLRIELPLGSYQPAFHFDPETSGSTDLPAGPPRPPVTHPARPVKWLTVMTAIGVLAVGALLLPGLIRAPSAADRLWQPFLNGNNPVLISLATLPNTQPTEKGREERATPETGFVGTGAALGAARFAEQLAWRHQPFLLKFGRDVAFSDLKSAPAILLGGGTRWADELLRSLRFRIQRGAESRAIVDSRVAGRAWSVQGAHTTPEAVEGYSLVTRLLNSESGQPVLLVAGLDPRDTQAGVEFLTNNGLFEPFVQSLPPDWARKSFQAVLHNSIHGNSSGSLTVVAFEVW